MGKMLFLHKPCLEYPLFVLILTHFISSNYNKIKTPPCELTLIPLETLMYAYPLEKFAKDALYFSLDSVVQSVSK